MGASRRSSQISDGNESRNTGRREQVDIQGLKVWAKDNLPARSYLCDILLREEGLLTVEAFLAKMDIWLKLVDLEEQPHI